MGGYLLKFSDGTVSERSLIFNKNGLCLLWLEERKNWGLIERTPVLKYLLQNIHYFYHIHTLAAFSFQHQDSYKSRNKVKVWKFKGGLKSIYYIYRHLLGN